MVNRPLNADWYNPAYQAGIRHCFGALTIGGQSWSQESFRYEGEDLWIESDMWCVAQRLVELPREEREVLGWRDLYARALLTNAASNNG
jgi:hypothetical protein